VVRSRLPGSALYVVEARPPAPSWSGRAIPPPAAAARPRARRGPYPPLQPMHREGRHHVYAPVHPFSRQAPPRDRGYPDRPGASRPPRRVHDADLHARPEPAPGRCRKPCRQTRPVNLRLRTIPHRATPSYILGLRSKVDAASRRRLTPCPIRCLLAPTAKTRSC
jgi:hypothetical protein